MNAHRAARRNFAICPPQKAARRRHVSGGAMKAVVLLAIACWASRAQEFEVVSVKAAPPPDGRGMTVRTVGGPGSKDPTRWGAENFSLANLINMAYRLNTYEFDPPSWMHTTIFNVEARVPEGATRQDLAVMMRHVLEERFKIVVHREQKEVPAYDLVVAKNGPKFKEAASAPPPEIPVPGPRPTPGPGPKLDKDGYPEVSEAGGMAVVNGKVRIRQPSGAMAYLASVLSGQLGRIPVTDATGLTGKYDFTLSWSGIATRMAASPDAQVDSDTGPTLFAALQEQLGLKLESRKKAVEILIVDHIERTPTEN
jgi:uncharacterized protein (TIGR03435 family)